MNAMILEPPAGLAEFQPAQRYFLIDQHRLDLSSQPDRADVLGLLFRLELSETAGVLTDAVGLLAAWLNASGQSDLRNAGQALGTAAW